MSDPLADIRATIEYIGRERRRTERIARIELAFLLFVVVTVIAVLMLPIVATL